MTPATYKVNTSSGNLTVRKTPNGPSTGLSKKKGAIVTVTEMQDGWSKIAEGWVSSQYLLKVEDAPATHTASGSYKFIHQPIDYPAKDQLVLRTAGLSSVKGAMFGMTRSYPDGSPKPHQGIDLSAPPGTPIFAVENGEVVDVRESSAYGKVLCMRADEGELKGKFFFYAHLKQVDLKVGTKVKAGDVMGQTGSTGNASAMTTVEKGSHLHFEARTAMLLGTGLTGRFDPLPYIRLK